MVRNMFVEFSVCTAYAVSSIDLVEGAEKIGALGRNLLWVAVIIGILVLIFTLKDVVAIAFKSLLLVVIGGVVYFLLDENTFKQLGETIFNLFFTDTPADNVPGGGDSIQGGNLNENNIPNEDNSPGN